MRRKLIMSDEPEDVEDITSICGGLNINIGTLHRTSIDGMYRAGAKSSFAHAKSCSIQSAQAQATYVLRPQSD